MRCKKIFKLCWIKNHNQANTNHEGDNMKKIVLGLTACVLSAALTACGANQADLGQNLNNKMNNLEKTICSISPILNSEFNVDEPVVEKGVQTRQFGQFGNINQFPYFNNYLNGYYGGYMGYGMPYGYMGYGLGMPYGINTFNPYLYSNHANPNYGRFTNIDTYRINQITQDGKTTTTIDSFHNGENTSHDEFVEDAVINNEQTETSNQTPSDNQNLQTFCLISNLYGNQLKEDILENIQSIKSLANDLNTLNNKLSLQQIKSVNEHLNNISRTENKINLQKYEMKQNVKNIDNTNSKYLKLLSSMDTRNTYLQSILNSLLQVENCIDSSCNHGIVWNGINTNSEWINSCPHGECNNCTDCNNCQTCNNCSSCTNSGGCINCNNCSSCILCTDCTDCEGCFNCKDCENCTNLANVTGWKNNMPCENCTQNEQENSQTENTESQPLPQNPSSGSARVDNGEASSNDDINQTEIKADITQDEQVEPVSADDTVKNNLVTDDNVAKAEYLSDNAQNIKPSQPDNVDNQSNQSIFNENERENNKGLTA